jgi:hypothetical protein
MLAALYRKVAQVESDIKLLRYASRRFYNFLYQYGLAPLLQLPLPVCVQSYPA